ncbi:BQ5605_C003g02131 [Microbotryum silenes-dioicae]|uniref:BQ5605_C003g02131 protein n=1 Tax=Microbotryum silenes-dioicae TaxID=796604 RepID=A0A2X0P3J9_9BASI|nr:BQ5605_C003g02131 [Microbotryum silenes-dioicae]
MMFFGQLLLASCETIPGRSPQAAHTPGPEQASNLCHYCITYWVEECYEWCRGVRASRWSGSAR